MIYQIAYDNIESIRKFKNNVADLTLLRTYKRRKLTIILRIKSDIRGCSHIMSAARGGEGVQQMMTIADEEGSTRKFKNNFAD